MADLTPETFAAAHLALLREKQRRERNTCPACGRWRQGHGLPCAWRGCEAGSKFSMICASPPIPLLPSGATARMGVRAVTLTRVSFMSSYGDVVLLAMWKTPRAALRTSPAEEHTLQAIFDRWAP